MMFTAMVVSVVVLSAYWPQRMMVTSELPDHTCEILETRCNDGSCVPIFSRLCPEFQPCPGHKPERCHDGHCYDKDGRCNGQIDCMDGSDEEGCDEYCKVNGELFCGTGGCFPVSKRCDGSADCDNESDEQECTDASTIQLIVIIIFFGGVCGGVLKWKMDHANERDLDAAENQRRCGGTQERASDVRAHHSHYQAVEDATLVSPSPVLTTNPLDYRPGNAHRISHFHHRPHFANTRNFHTPPARPLPPPNIIGRNMTRLPEPVVRMPSCIIGPQVQAPQPLPDILQPPSYSLPTPPVSAIGGDEEPPPSYDEALRLLHSDMSDEAPPPYSDVECSISYIQPDPS